MLTSRAGVVDWNMIHISIGKGQQKCDKKSIKNTKKKLKTEAVMQP